MATRRSRWSRRATLVTAVGVVAAVGEATEVPRRSPGRGPPYWKSRVLRRQVLGDEEG